MFSFFVWETVTIPMELESEDGTTGILEDYKDIIVSFSQRGGILFEMDSSNPKMVIDTANDEIDVRLEQEETGQFSVNTDILVQANILYEDTERDTTAMAIIRPLANLHKAVMR